MVYVAGKPREKWGGARRGQGVQHGWNNMGPGRLDQGLSSLLPLKENY